jgi:hypothetical protein
MPFDGMVAEKRRVASGELRRNTRLRAALVEMVLARDELGVTND